MRHSNIVRRYLRLISCLRLPTNVIAQRVAYATALQGPRLYKRAHGGGVATIYVGPDVSFSPIICRAIVIVIARITGLSRRVGVTFAVAFGRGVVLLFRREFEKSR